MPTPFVRQLRLDGFLSFAPGSHPVELRPLNILIGPNGSGKSNFLDAFYLLAQLREGEAFQAALRAGGGASEWLWKGGHASTIEVDLWGERERSFNYRITWAPPPSSVPHAVILDESFVELPTTHGRAMTYFRTSGRNVEVAARPFGPAGPEPYVTQSIARHFFTESMSILSQRRAPDSFPDNAWLGEQFARMTEFREWTFGRGSAPRSSHRTDIPTDGLLPGGTNLAMMLQELSHRGAASTTSTHGFAGSCHAPAA